MDKKEYIERKEVNSEINKLPLTEDAAMEILWAIDHIPTADVAPVKHGEWIFGEFDGIGNSVECSACGFCQKSVDPKLWIEYPAHKFCGVCGAKMDGKDNDSNE